MSDDLCGACCHPWDDHGPHGCLKEVSFRYTCDCEAVANPEVCG